MNTLENNLQQELEQLQSVAGSSRQWYQHYIIKLQELVTIIGCTESTSRVQLMPLANAYKQASNSPFNEPGQTQIYKIASNIAFVNYWCNSQVMSGNNIQYILSSAVRRLSVERMKNTNIIEQTAETIDKM